MMAPGDFVEVLEHSIQNIIATELSAILLANPYQRVDDRKNYLTGYRMRKEPLNTGLGPVNLSIPKLRSGSFYRSILEYYQRVDRALMSIIDEAYFPGASTFKMNKLFADLRISKIDRSFVSRCAAQIDEEVEIWKNRPLGQCYAYICLDAIYTKSRVEGKVNSVAVLIAIGLREDGHRDVLDLHLCNRESYYKWKGFLQCLNALGLERSELWMSKEHNGLIKAIEECFPGQQRQSCIVHWTHNTQSKVSKRDFLWLLPLLKDLVGSRTTESFQLAWTEFNRAAQSKGMYKLLEWLDESYHEISVYLDFRTAYWSRIKCTNSLERLNEELRRREKCIRIFPDEKSYLRLFGTILQDYSEDWISGKLYLSKHMEKSRENLKKLCPLTHRNKVVYYEKELD